MSGEGFILTTTGDSPIAGFSKAKHQIDTLMLDELRALAEERAMIRPRSRWRPGGFTTCVGPWPLECPPSA